MNGASDNGRGVTPPDKLKVFISYSRDDLKIADQLDAGLKLCGYEPMLDRHGISGGEEWRNRLGSLIRDADTIVFVLSPASAVSEVCKWEVEEAARLNKRIIPVLARPLDGATPPPLLSEKNYIFLYDEPQVPGSGLVTGLVELTSALQTDLTWIREHTRLLARATEWDRGGRPINRLLSGSDISDAKDWAAKRPKDAPPPTNLHLDYIKASEDHETAQSDAQRIQLALVARAQEEREAALVAAEEALDREAHGRKRRTQLRNGALAAISLFALFAGWEWSRAVAERKIAQTQTTQAEIQKRLAQRQTLLARQQRGIAETQKAAADWQKKNALDMLDVSTDLIVQLSKKHKFEKDDYAKALAIFRKGAEQENSMSMANLGLLYENGWGVDQDAQVALSWYEKSAALGNNVGMKFAGDIYRRGRLGSKDKVKALEWYQKAADEGNADGMYGLGLIYEAEGPASYSDAEHWYRAAAEKGSIYALENLGFMHEYGRGVPKDFEAARTFFQQALDAGLLSAIGDLAELYTKLDPPNRDYAKARELFEQGIAKGDTVSMYGLAYMYERGAGVDKDFARARDLYEQAAAHGHIGALTALGALYSNAVPPNRDYAKARELYEDAAAKGDTSAISNLGIVYEYGKGVPKDLAKAKSYFDRAIALGDTQAITNLGVLYSNGDAPYHDDKKALAQYEEAAARGDPAAMANLGISYENGEGVDKDIVKAKSYYEQSAAAGYATGWYLLAKFYAAANYPGHDNAKAKELFAKAADLGNEDAKLRLKKIAYQEAEEAGNYAAALEFRKTYVATVEANEVARAGTPAGDTADALVGLAWDALMIRDFVTALEVSERGHKLDPTNVAIETNRAHALLFLHKKDEAKALYLEYRGKPVYTNDSKIWETVIAEDFAVFRKNGLFDSQLEEVENDLGLQH
jgi:TPR repeat protein